MSGRGYLGTDTGAKVATLEVMLDQDTARPHLGYWAERWDPDGSLHPIYDARSVDGDWVHVTTLPMLELARPLYALGGYRLALVLPMLGGVGTAFAARALARRSAEDSGGWLAYWVVGLVSPIAVYSLDLWEHAPGVAFMVGAVALLAAVVDGAPHRGRALGAGALLGIAATMRTEALVYALVSVAMCGIALLVTTRRPRRPVEVGLLSIVGFAGPWLANAWLESALGGNSRSARATSTVGGGVGELGERAREATITMLALRPGDLGQIIVVGGGLVALVLVAIALSARGEARMVRMVLAAALALHLITIAQGAGFVPGMLAAAPVAIVGLARPGPTPGIRYAWAVALGALPLVWAFQLLGGAFPQWAGRYALTSCIVLVAVGSAALQRATPDLRIGLVVLSGVVTVSGVLWLGQRTHGMDGLFRQLVERREDVVVARNGFFIREGGPAYTARRWLTAVTEEDLDDAVDVIEAAGLETFAVLDEDPDAPAIEGAVAMGTTRTSVVGVALYLHAYRLDQVS